MVKTMKITAGQVVAAVAIAIGGLVINAMGDKIEETIDNRNNGDDNDIYVPDDDDDDSDWR